jgi:hypothetical protein
MLPYILAAVGGYLIGQSQKKDVPQMAKVGEMANGGYIQDGDDVKMAFNKKTVLEIYESDDSELDNPVEEIFNEGEVFEVIIFGIDKYKYDVQFGDGSVAFIRKEDVNVIEVNEEKYEDGGEMAKGGKVLVGRFDEKQLRNGEDKKAIEKKMKETGLKYIDSRIIKKNGKPHIMEVYLYADGGMMEKGGKIPEKEIESLKKNVYKWYGKNGMTANDEDAEFVPPVTEEEIEVAVKEYVKYCNREGVDKWGGGDSFDREVIVDIMLYNRNPENESYFYPTLLKEIKSTTDLPPIYKKGGKVKSKKWIQDALGGDTGSLRRTAKRKGLLRGDENLSMTDLKKLQKMGGKTGKRAHLAETLRKFD